MIQDRNKEKASRREEKIRQTIRQIRRVVRSIKAATKFPAKFRLVRFDWLEMFVTQAAQRLLLRNVATWRPIH